MTPLSNKEEVSLEVRRAAYAYGKQVLKESGDAGKAIAAHYAFIAGALYSKPFEHNAKPEDKKSLTNF